MSPNRPLKRRCIDPPPPPTTTRLLFYDNFVFLKHVVEYLTLKEIGSIMLVCRAFRSCLVYHEPIWTILLYRRCPNLQFLQHRPTGRAAFLQRLQLDSDPNYPVRTPALPMAFQPSPTELLRRLQKPTCIVFLYDLWRNGTRIVSTAKRLALDEMGNMRKPLPFVFDFEIKDMAAILEAEELQNELDSLPAQVLPPTRLRCTLSFQLEGERTPQHAPIVLLRERDMLCSSRTAAIFRTDVRDDAGRTVRRVEEARERLAKWQKDHTLAYGCSPLSFDTLVHVIVSPRSKNMSDHARFSSCDQKGVCRISLGTYFGVGVERTSFKEGVLPSLLRLVNDRAA